MCMIEKNHLHIFFFLIFKVKYLTKGGALKFYLLKKEKWFQYSPPPLAVVNWGIMTKLFTAWTKLINFAPLPGQKKKAEYKFTYQNNQMILFYIYRKCTFVWSTGYSFMVYEWLNIYENVWNGYNPLSILINRKFWR